MLTSHLEVIATMSYTSHYTVINFLKKFRVLDLQWVIVVVPYAHSPSRGYSDRVVHLASHNYQFLKSFRVPDLQWVIAAVPWAHIPS